MKKLLNLIIGSGRDIEALTLYELDDGSGMLEFSIIPQNCSFFDRFKKAWNFLFHGPLREGSIYLDSNALDHLRKKF